LYGALQLTAQYQRRLYFRLSDCFQNVPQFTPPVGRERALGIAQTGPVVFGDSMS
jgi:hypothetical protein